MVILVSYAGVEETSPMAMDIGSQPRRIYALIRLSHLVEVFKVDHVNSVPYQSVCSRPFLLDMAQCDMRIIDSELWRP